ncbi:MAG TPA: DUF4097 family beta strand repeat-containing protein [Gemmatimonadaceae bacterium]|nr:DUF4097 family beta strand repeat-containing protein [Gemmatimonadaceae bacterium]
MRRRTALLIPLVLGFVSSTAWAQGKGHKRGDRDDDIVARLDTTVTVQRGGRVSLGIVSGRIIVTAGSGSSVRIHATLEDGGRFRFRATDSGAELGVEADDHELGDAHVEVSVPAGVLIAANTVSGDISVRDTRGVVEAHTVSGDVAVTGAAERVSAESVSGDVEVRGVTASVRAQSVSGNVQAENVSGDVQGETVSGDIILHDVRSRSARASTTSGDVEYDGTIGGDGRYEFQSHSGDVRISLPSGADATVTVETFSGELDSDVPITLQPGQVMTPSRRLSFKVGNGSGQLSVRSFSGDITIRRGSGAH